MSEALDGAVAAHDDGCLGCRGVSADVAESAEARAVRHILEEDVRVGVDLEKELRKV